MNQNFVFCHFRDFIRLTNTTVEAVSKTFSEEEEAEEDEENEEEDVHETTHSDNQRMETMLILKALTSLLNVYAKFNAAKSVYMEPKLLEMYEQLLGTRFEGIQKAALACIFSYRNTILATYR